MKNTPDTAGLVAFFFLEFASFSFFGIAEKFVQLVKILFTMLGSLSSNAASLPVTELFVGVVDLRLSVMFQTDSARGTYITGGVLVLFDLLLQLRNRLVTILVHDSILTD